MGTMGGKKKNGTYIYEFLETKLFKGLPKPSINGIVAHPLPNPVYGGEKAFRVFAVVQLLIPLDYGPEIFKSCQASFFLMREKVPSR